MVNAEGTARAPMPGRTLVDRYAAHGWWGTRTISEAVRANAATAPDAPAFLAQRGDVSWQTYSERADEVARTLIASGVAAGDRVGVLMPDEANVHAAFVGVERAGAVIVGVGQRAGDAEIAHLLGRTGARTLVTACRQRDRDPALLPGVLGAHGVGIDRQVLVDDDGACTVRETRAGEVSASHAVTVAELGMRDGLVGPNDLWLLNSTSGTTGLPKLVTQFQNRWMYFHQLAVRAGELTPDDVFMSLIPAPFGFGIWTAHVTPTLLSAPCAVQPAFSVTGAIELIERARITVLCCVSTQFMMLLNSSRFGEADVSSLRVMFTGGEAVPYERAAEFERRTGASVLQFYGSNETGALSCTSTRDTQEQRLGTAGRVIDDMNVRLFDEHGRDVTATGGPGRPAASGPALCAGYFDDPEANAQLYTPDGWMLMGDLVTVDADGYLRVVGRISDLVIRGGKNISAAQVEDEVATHPAVELVAVVPVPDATFGERVCAVVVLRPGAELALGDLADHMAARGASKDIIPEHIVVVDRLPMASGGKVAKGRLREMVLSMPGPAKHDPSGSDR